MKGSASWKHILCSRTLKEWGTRLRSWLRHCGTSRKVAGSIPVGVTGTFHWNNPSCRAIAQGSTQPLIEMNTRNISWGVKAAGATFMCRFSWNLGATTSWNPQGLSRPVLGLLYLYCKYTIKFRVKNVFGTSQFNMHSKNINIGLNPISFFSCLNFKNPQLNNKPIMSSLAAVILTHCKQYCHLDVRDRNY